MPAYKDSKTGTWFVKFYCKDWTGENKQIKGTKEKVTPFFATFSFVPFIFYCPWVPVPPEVFSEVPSDPIASSALCAEYAACVPG